MSDDPIKDLNTLLTSEAFSRQNADKVVRCCIDAARIVYERQKQTGKKELKPKEISSAIVLAETLHSNAYRFRAVGPLAALFGEYCDEGTALDYFEKYVEGEVADRHGRKIIIDTYGIKSLYKEQGTGLHVEDPDNYEQSRGKRLPWIRHTIGNSTGIYVVEDSGSRGGMRRKYVYTATVTIPLGKSEDTSYYVVIVREQQKGHEKQLRFVTAFSMDDRTGLLRAIAMGSMYIHEKKGSYKSNPAAPIEASKAVANLPLK